jgi:NADH dehydrogenase FAD-containing subunit
MAAVPFVPNLAIARPLLGRLVIVGGGFAGATLAKFAKALEPKLSVTLIEAQSRYVACPMSNLVLAGQRQLTEQMFDYRALAESGVDVIYDYAVDVDAVKQVGR